MPRSFHKPARFALAGLFAVLLLVLPASQAHAGGVGAFFGAVGDVLSDAIKSLIETAVFGIMGAFKSLLVLFLQFMGGILDWVMSPDFNNGIIRQPFVQQGWAIVRDFANMFFVVILVIIAIATILRQENFGIRRTLPTLIIIALLVNFSLILVGFVVDVSQIFMIYFLGAFDDKDFATVLVNATRFDDLFSNTSINWTDQMSDWEELGVRFVLKTMELLALTFAIAVVALLAVLFVIRTVILWVVAILAPLAFVSYILPASRGLWNNWLKQLTNWTLFGPAAVFFLFLAGKLMENMSSGPMSSFGQGASALSFRGGGSEFMGHGAPFIQAAAIFTFIFLAINAAKMFTGGIGNMVASKIEGWRRGAVKGAFAPARWAGRKTKEAAVERGREEAAKRLGRPARKGAEFAESVAAGEHALGKLPLGFGWAARGIARQVRQPLRDFEARGAALIDAKQKNLSQNKDEAVVGAAKAAADPLEKVAAHLEASTRGILDKAHGFDDDKVIAVMEHALKYDRAKPLEKARPELMTQTQQWKDWKYGLGVSGMSPAAIKAEEEKKMDAHMTKYSRQDAARVAAEALGDDLVQGAIARTWTNNQAAGLVQEGTNAQVRAFEEAIRNMTKAAGDFDATLQMIKTVWNNPGLAKALQHNPILATLNIR